MTFHRLKIFACLGLTLLLLAAPIQAKVKSKPSKKTPTTQPTPESHYMIMMPDEKNSHNTTETPPYIASPERIMKAKPEGDKKSLNQ